VSILEDKEHIRSPRIKELEGLRGCLAWWVVLLHFYLNAGMFRDRLPFYEEWIASGSVAVEIFIILSGYVIALLLETQREPYGVYITRRFFRLAPLYYVLCAWGVAEAIWRGNHGDRLGYHLLLHLTMLHGLAPDEVLPGSATAFNFQAWSISVEWQFYLIAPLILALVKGSATRATVIVVGCLVASTVLLKRYHFPFAATVVMRAGLFSIGIASFYLTRLVVRHREAAGPLVPFLLPVGIASAWVAGSFRFGAWPLWIVVFSAVLADVAGSETGLTRPLRRFLGLPFVVWLGTISYSTYLCHGLAIEMVESLLGPSLREMAPRGRALRMIGLGFPLTLGLSAALYYLVEKPGIWAGKVLASKIGRRPAVEPAQVHSPGAAALIEGKVGVVEARPFKGPG
jgi:peptidoglycan/LPS O-acetylase OafA/YrhL